MMSNSRRRRKLAEAIGTIGVQTILHELILPQRTIFVRALASEFGDTGLPVVKDPRMCRLMRFWAPVFGEAKWSVRALLPLRSPLEVAWSLKRRDDIGPGNGCLTWLRHVLDAEAETRRMARAFFNRRHFLADKRRTLARVGEQLDLIWPSQNESV